MRPTRLHVLFVAALVLAAGLRSAATGEQAPAPPKPSFRMATVTYETGFDFEDYNSVRELFPFWPEFLRPWGEHPIIWKHLVRPELNFDPWTVDPFEGPLVFDGVPAGLTIGVGDSVALDNYESSGAFTDAAGETVDPTGHWVETFTLDGEEVAILAAMAIWEWSTPVYINYTYSDGVNPTALIGVIDSVTLSVPSGPPHVVCGWDDPDPSISCPGLVIESVKMTYYSDVCLCGDPQVDYYDGPEVNGSDFVSIYENSYDVGPVLYDPPKFFEAGAPTPLFFEQASRAQAADVLLRNSDGSLSEPK